MPRIDPQQLLKCLGVLLRPNGGIKSKEEVSRLASLMTKFSKKLVSKCIYVSILKATEIDLLDMFMSAGGWHLLFNWLSDGIAVKNWALVAELVELLIICPVDIERLKGNNCPKLIKVLSKDPSASDDVRRLACGVVDQWLAIVKGACEHNSLTANNALSNNVPNGPVAQEAQVSSTTDLSDEKSGEEQNINESTVPKGVYKITIRDGKKLLAEILPNGSEPRVDNMVEEAEVDAEDAEEEKPTQKEDKTVAKEEKTERAVLKVVNEDPIAQESLPPKKLAEGKKAQLSLKRKTESKQASEPEKKSLKDKKKDTVEKKPKLDLKLKPKLKDRDRKYEKSDKSHKEKTAEEKAQEEKDKQSLMKLITPSIGGLGKIPKKSKDDKKEEKKDDKKSSVLKSPPDSKKPPLAKDPKKYNISIETRKGEDRPKTVKTFNSRFRSTGLEELPPPPKSSKKKDEPPHEKKPLKRTSPIKEVHVPEKKPKEEHNEKPALSSPTTKPKMGLQESDVFADALTAANPVKDVKKRKRRTSTSKDASASSDTKKENASKSDEKEAVKPVFKFYQDTLITSEEKSVAREEAEDNAKDDAEDSPEDSLSDGNDTLTKEELEDEVAQAEKAIDNVLKLEEKKNVEREKNRIPKGILSYMKKYKTLKKSVTFKEKDLVSIRHFELDETERVNVTKTFMDMSKMEKYNERILFQRKLATEDIMEEKTPWRPLIPIDVPAGSEAVIPGQKSVEKDIQAARERTTLQAIYFNRSLIPDSPQEPDLEIHAMTEPASIPLKDTTGSPDSVISYRDRPWPESKGYPPGSSGSPPHGPASPPQQHEFPMQQHPQPQQQMIPMQGPGGMYPPQFQPQPPMQPFMAPALLPNPEWMGAPDGNMMMGGPPAGDPGMMMGPGMNPGPGMPPGLLPPPDMYNMGGAPPHPDFMGNPYQMGGPPPGMYPGGGPPGGGFGPQPDVPPGQRNPRPWFRGQDSSRGGGGGGTWRHPSKGGWTQNKMCKFYLKKGHCRQSNCAFRHGSGKGGIR